MFRRRAAMLVVMVPVCLVGLSGLQAGNAPRRLDPPAKAPAAQAESFCFVQITDTHFGSPGHAARTAQAVAAINRLPMKIEFVLHTGDVFSDNIADKKVSDEAAGTLGALKAPLYVIPGNHDVLRSRKGRADRLAETTRLFAAMFGPLNRRWEAGGVVFLSVCTEPLARDYEHPGHDPLKWLAVELARTGDRPVIVCHHTPSVPDFYGNRMHSGWPEKHRRAWRKVLGQAKNLRAVLAGHFHRDEHHWLGDVPLYVASSVAGYWGRQGSFRIYQYRAGRLSYRTVYLRQPAAK